MPIVRLTDSQREEAGDRIDQAKRMARRFRPPAGMSRDEWEAEVLLVMVETVAAYDRNTNFEAYFFMRCRWRRLNLIRQATRHPVAALIPETIPARAERTALDDLIQGVSPRESDLIRLRLAGGEWSVIGKAYGVSGRTAQRWHRQAIGKLRKRVEA